LETKCSWKDQYKRSMYVIEPGPIICWLLA